MPMETPEMTKTELRVAMARHNLTRSQLAYVLGVSHHTVHGWMRGAPIRGAVVILATLLGAEQCPQLLLDRVAVAQATWPDGRGRRVAEVGVKATSQSR